MQSSSPTCLYGTLKTAMALLVCGTALASADPVAEKIQPACRPFKPGQVQLLDGPCKAAREANLKYLLSLDADRLLYVFRKNAGLPAPGEPLGGWEAPDCEVRGHFVGHYLSACAILSAATGDPRIKARGELMVAELAKCQQALGGGYLSAFPESFFDRWEKTQRVWAPYYTIHKIMAGLYDQYTLCGNAQAFDVLKGMAAYFKKRTDAFSFADMDRMMDRNEEGGIDELFWNLYALTGDPDHRTLAERFEERSFLNQMAVGHDCLTGRHGNTHIPLAIGAARRYELTGESRYCYMAAYFWDRVVNTRSFATGGSTNGEIWGPAYTLAGTLSNTNHETCKTYNMLRLTRDLFCWTADPVYADFYERAFLNGILGTQEPRTGMLEYYVPQATGYQRVYGTPTTAFWCCYGTGIETFSKLTDSIYFHDAAGVYLNLFIASTLDWPEGGLRLRQDTHFPETPATTLTVEAAPAQARTLRIRIPGWAAGAKASLNGQPIDGGVPGQYLSIARVWKAGDKVELTLPMALHSVPMPDDPSLVALAYGPVVLAGLVEGDTAGEPVESSDMAGPRPQMERLPRFYFLAESPRDLTWLKPVEGRPLTFRAASQPFDITFVPFYQVISQAYGLYWPVVPKGSDRHAALERENRTVKEVIRLKNPPADETFDRVQPGDRAGEQAHAIKGQRTESGSYMNQRWRDARDGGWWSWEMAVRPDLPVRLLVVYWGSDVGDREFDIQVNGKTIATQELTASKPDEFFSVTYPIPAELTHGKNKVEVRFQGKPGKMAGGVFFCATIR